MLVGYWPDELGPILCDLWLSVDYTVCLVSQFTVLLITVDRFCSVKIAARYRAWRTGGKVVIMIIMTWTIPAVLFFVSIFGWQHFIGKRDLRRGECMVQFLKDPVFNTSLIVGYYWIPLCILCVLYGFIFEAAWVLSKKSAEKEKERQKLLAMTKKPSSGTSGASNTAVGIAAVAMTASLATSKTYQAKTPDSRISNNSEKPKDNNIGQNDSAQKAPANPTDHQITNNNNNVLPSTTASNPKLPPPPPPKRILQHVRNAVETSSCSSNGDLDVRQQLSLNPAYLPRPKPGRNKFNDLDSYHNTSDQTSTQTPTPAPTPSPSVSLSSTLTPTSNGHARPSTLNLRGSKRNFKKKRRSSLDMGPRIIDNADLRYMDESSVVVPSPIIPATDDISSLGPQDDSSDVGSHVGLQKIPQPMSPLSPFDQKTYLYGRPIRKSNTIGSKTNLPLPISDVSNEDYQEEDSSTPQDAISSSNPRCLCQMRVDGEEDGSSFPPYSDDQTPTPSGTLRGNCASCSNSSSCEGTSTSSGSECGECCAGHAPYPYNSNHTRSVASSISMASKGTQISPTTVKIMYAAAKTKSQLRFLPSHCEYSETASESGTDKGVQTPVSDFLPPFPTAVNGLGDVVLQQPQPHSTILATFQNPTPPVNIVANQLPYIQPAPPTYSSTSFIPTLPGYTLHNKKPDPPPRTQASVSFASRVETVNMSPPPPPLMQDNVDIQSKMTQQESQTSDKWNNSSNRINGEKANTIERAATLQEEDGSSTGIMENVPMSKEEESTEFKRDIMRKIGKRIRFRKRKKDKQRTENRAKKALRTISVILGAFVACWTPYHVFAIIASFCPTCINVHLYMFSYFLCYLNSPINPFCYAASNQQFKQAFKRIMRGDLSMR